MARRHVEQLYTGKHLGLNSINGWEFATRVRGSGVVIVVAVTKQDELILTEQFRPPINKRVVDWAAGLSGDITGEEEETLLTAAQRELLEETGYVSDDWEYCFTGPSSAGMTTEMLSFFVARKCYKKGKGGGDDSEDIEVHLVPKSKARQWLKRKSTKRRRIDPKVYAGLGLLSLSTDDE
ncbi:MAG: NUDIX hydrolase [Planctomycetaceae bacterium]|nr:NUDIX hydrolase [Planctomycetaceae bacterium]